MAQPPNRRLIVILVAAACGAVIGAVGTKLRLTPLFNIPALQLDPALKGHTPFLVACGIGWVLFSGYWEIAAKSASPPKSSESRGSRMFHVALANIALVLEFLPIRGLGRFLPTSFTLMTAGVAVEWAGLALAIWSRIHLGRNWSGAIAINEDHQLIRSGPYRILRHPIYTGLLAMYVGVAMVSGEWLALIGLAIVTFAYWRKIRLEEANLYVSFGKDYEAYRTSTWALVPGIF